MNMKTFDLTIRISANPNLTEADLMDRFSEFLDSIPKEVNRKVFQADCCMVEIIVNEVKD